MTEARFTDNEACPRCHHVHLDYWDEPCVSCGCEAMTDTAEAVRAGEAIDPRVRLVRDLAAYIHGADCTCPYSVEPADLARAESLLASVR